MTGLPGDSFDRPIDGGDSQPLGGTHLEDLAPEARAAFSEIVGAGSAQQTEALAGLRAKIADSAIADAATIIESDPSISVIDQIAILLNRSLDAWDDRIEAKAVEITDSQNAGRPTEQLVTELEELQRTRLRFEQDVAQTLMAPLGPLNRRIVDDQAPPTGGGGPSLVAVGVGVAAVAAIAVAAFAVLGGGEDSAGNEDNQVPTAVVGQATSPTGSATPPAPVDTSDTVFPVPALTADLGGATNIEAAVRVRVGDAGGVTFLVDRSAIMEPPGGGEIRVFVEAGTDGAFIESALSSGAVFSPSVRVFERPSIVELARVPLDPADAIATADGFELFFPLVQTGGGPAAIVAGENYALTGLRLSAATRDADNNELFLGIVIIDAVALAELQAEYAATAARVVEG